MKQNAVPHYDMSVNETGCCPRFNPEVWDEVTLHFVDKPFLRATTKSANHVPMDMDEVFTRVHQHMSAADAIDDDNTLVLSRDLSASLGEHLFAIPDDVEVPDEERISLTGDFITRVFEGPYEQAGSWMGAMIQAAKDQGGDGEEVYFFYTTCPKCAEFYGKNYVVGVARV
jgi:hypothetical protein